MIDCLKEIILHFIKRYENSNRSIGGASKKRIALYPNKDIKGYKDDFDICKDVNAEILFLIGKGYLQGKLQPNNIYEKVIFIENPESLSYFYSKLEKEQKQNINYNLINLLAKYKNNNKILSSFCTEQINNLALNKKVKFCNVENLSDFEDILKSLSIILNQKKEILIRVLSKEIFNDSKKLEILKSKLEAILYAYGDFGNTETVFEELNIVKTPSFIFIKGDTTIVLKNNNVVSTRGLLGGYGICSMDIENIVHISINCKNVVTIENLTNYFLFDENESVAIFLGGFHNSAKRELLKKIHIQNSSIKFYHFGDIDAGGFYILEHLKRKTNIEFEPQNMNIPTMQKYKDFWQPLTSNDKARLTKLKESNLSYKEIVDFMLDNNCKFEQEAVCCNGIDE